MERKRIVSKVKNIPFLFFTKEALDTLEAITIQDGIRDGARDDTRDEET